ncbi:Cation/H(+) antiporter like [Quillaja saponaria]|uniref:Cation/H(+) antiporter like n=1 Tax=Quillaja saponaria TaxID=32244 RepID=A0AAD7PX06_QUISA|nr:Cation/H(+) antiporter like [Quillaja saponaria]
MFNPRSQDVLEIITKLGYMLFLFVMGVKMDVGMVRKTGRTACFIGVLCLLVPLSLGLVTAKILSNKWKLEKEDEVQLFYVSTVHAMTCFPVIVTRLDELQIVNSELGRVALSAAMVSELLSVTLTAIVTFTSQKSVAIGVLSFVATIVFVILIMTVVRRLMFWIIKQTPKGQPIKNSNILYIIMGVFLSGLVSHHVLNQSVLFGPFILGLAIPAGPPLGSTLVQKLESWVSQLFMPMFTSVAVLKANMQDIGVKTKLSFVHGIVLPVNIVSKFVGAMIPSLYSKMPMSDAIALALTMSCKGIVELASYSFARDLSVVNGAIYVSCVLYIQVNASIVSILIKHFYDPSRKYACYQRRNIMHSKIDSDMRILACIHNDQNISPVIEILDVACMENPINASVLHLIRLVGRAAPIFISHQIQGMINCDHTYSTNVVFSLSAFQVDKGDSFTFLAFTAISPIELMHEDICTLALNNLSSLIILPFHRQWSCGGSTELIDATIRNLNRSVLDKHPCSVAILADRRFPRDQNDEAASARDLYSVLVIFIGGKDDREALCFAGRLMRKPNIILDILHLVSADDADDEGTWEKMLDSEILKDIRHSTTAHGSTVNYMEEMVKDGPETVTILRSLAMSYDLFIVGRRYNAETRHTHGLDDWSEFPELGVIGDMLASTDFNSRASTLVIQQQPEM